MSSESGAHQKREIVAGDYILGRRLGSGGFGSVYEARHKDTQLPYAIKRISLSEEDAERFRKEALYPARIASQSMYVLPVHSFFQDREQGYFYLVTELIPQGDLRDFLDQNPKPLPLKLALELAIGIARGLVAIHEQHIVHRDVKPRNILMDWKDGRWIPKIADFGLARSTESVSLGEFASAGYAAPEQLDIAGDRGPGPDSDLFSFGMILYELLTGDKPNSATNLQEYARWLKEKTAPPYPSSVRLYLAQWPDLDFLVSELLEFDRDLRKTSAGEVVWTLGRILREVERIDTKPVPAPANPQSEATIIEPRENIPFTNREPDSIGSSYQRNDVFSPPSRIETKASVHKDIDPRNLKNRNQLVLLAAGVGGVALILLMIYVLILKMTPTAVPASSNTIATNADSRSESYLPTPGLPPSNPQPQPPAPKTEVPSNPPETSPKAANKGDGGTTKPESKLLPNTPLHPATGMIRFVALVAVEVFEKEKKLGETRLDVELPEGSHTFTFKYRPNSPGAPSYERQETVEVVKGKTIIADANFEITLRIISRPKLSTVKLTRGSTKIKPYDLGETDISSVILPIGGDLEFTTSQGVQPLITIRGDEKNNIVIVSSP